MMAWVFVLLINKQGYMTCEGVLTMKTWIELHDGEKFSDNSSDFDLGTILVDEKQVYFPIRNN